MNANQLVLQEWGYALAAERKSPRTVRSYGESLRMFAAFLDDQPVLEASTTDVQRFIADLLATRSPSTAAVRYRSLQQLYKWATTEGLTEANPMKTMRPPSIPETSVPVVPVDDLRKLLRACEGKEFLDLRDTALVRLMIEPGGMRRAEVVGLSVDSIDFEQNVAVVMGKGSRPRAIPFGNRSGQALTRYLRARQKHPNATRTNALWLAQRGALTDNGLSQALERRCALAGIPKIKAHQLRHTSADMWLSESGGDETSAMRLFGWRSRQMLSRYAASNADARARQAAQRLGVADKI